MMRLFQKIKTNAQIIFALTVLGLVLRLHVLDIIPNWMPSNDNISTSLPYLTSTGTEQANVDLHGNVPTHAAATKTARSSSQTAHNSVDSWLSKFKDGKKHPNVLFIVADDMRPEIGANIHEHSPWLEPGIITPHLDSLANKGMLFRRAYCQFSWCNPSRSSLLTSRRPDTTMVHNNSVYFRQNNPNFVSLPQYFKQNGYLTLAMGKVFHQIKGLPVSRDPKSWSLPTFHVDDRKIKQPNGRAWEAVKTEDRKGKPLLDETIANFARETLTSLAGLKGKPFFVAVGIKKPHFSFEFPEQFMDRYPLGNVSMPLHPKAAPTLPRIAWSRSFEVRDRVEYKNETDLWGMTQPLPDWITRDLRRAYYSCITYIDDLIGQLLRHLENLGLANDTIVSFIGDHGFHMGEHSIFGKNTAFEVANNAPMIIHVPGANPGGFVTDKLVEFVDIFPTLVELAGLPKLKRCPNGIAAQKVNLCTEGSSLVPLFRNPSTRTWKDRVFYQYPHYRGHGRHFCMGYSMRTARYRYTQWVDYNYDWKVKANWTNVCATELYDHSIDPLETNNLADDVKLSRVRKELRVKLMDGWYAALPTTKG